MRALRRRAKIGGMSAARLCFLLLVALAVPAAAQPAADRKAPPRPAQAEPAPPPPQQPQAAPPYERQLLRLSEMLGALHHLRSVCSATDANTWRDRMAALIEAEAPAPDRRDRLAGAFNDSYRAWARSYRACTPAAELAVRRFLDETSQLVADVNERYGQ
ncbi:TIGR02301 family protein [Methylopila henanensis]|uniref:TIGR02301 family protein n=1 Tax=Methylopila henanensis TaxID=873516 RepID=A0ABW4K6H2_9HYPH